MIPVLLGQYSLFDVLKNSTLLLGLLEISALCILLSIGLYVFKKVRVKQSVVPLFVFLAVVSGVFLLGIVVSYQPSRVIVNTIISVSEVPRINSHFPDLNLL